MTKGLKAAFYANNVLFVYYGSFVVTANGFLIIGLFGTTVVFEEAIIIVDYLKTDAGTE